MDKRDLRDKTKQSLKEMGLSFDLLNNPSFIIYVSDKLTYGFNLIKENNRLFLVKNNDLFRNDGRRECTKIGFRNGSITDKGRTIDGFFAEEITEIRTGNFKFLVAPSFLKWKYRKILLANISFYDEDGVLMQKQELTFSSRVNYQNGMYGIEAYNSNMNPYNEFAYIATNNSNGLINFIPLFANKGTNTLIKRNSLNPDKILCEKIVGGQRMFLQITNNGKSMKNLDKYNLNINLHYENRKTEDILKNDSFLKNFYNGKNVNLGYFMDEERKIYNVLIERLLKRVIN